METTTETDTRDEETLAEKLERLKEQAKDFASKHPVAVAAAVAVVGAVGAYFLWPREEYSPAGDRMKAPGSGGRVVSRKAFEEEKQPYFKVLRTEGAEKAVSFLK